MPDASAPDWSAWENMPNSAPPIMTDAQATLSQDQNAGTGQSAPPAPLVSPPPGQSGLFAGPGAPSGPAVDARTAGSDIDPRGGTQDAPEGPLASVLRGTPTAPPPPPGPPPGSSPPPPASDLPLPVPPIPPPGGSPTLPVPPIPPPGGPPPLNGGPTPSTSPLPSQSPNGPPTPQQFQQPGDPATAALAASRIQQKLAPVGAPPAPAAGTPPAPLPQTTRGGWDPNAVGDPGKIYGQVLNGETRPGARFQLSSTNAGGPAQFTNGTWGDFIKSPANTNGYTMADRDNQTPDQAHPGQTIGETAAQVATQWLGTRNKSLIDMATGRPATQGELDVAHNIGGGLVAAMAANPTGDFIATANGVKSGLAQTTISANPMYHAGMTNAQALAAGVQYYQKGSTGTHNSTAGADLGEVGIGGATPSKNQGPTAEATGFNMKDFVTQMMALQPNKNLRDQPGAMAGPQLLALAGGILKGRSFSNGLGQGFENMAGVQQAQAKQMMDENADVGKIALAGSQQDMLAKYRTQMAALAAGRLANTTNTADANIKYKEWLESPEGKAAQTQAINDHRTLTTGNVKDNLMGQDEIDTAGINAKKNLVGVQGMLDNIDKSGAGPQAADSFARWAALRMGIPLNGTSPAATQLVQAYTNMGQAQQAQSMKGLGLRTQNEFNTFIGGAANLTNSPDVARTLLNQVKQRAQEDSQMYDDYHAMPADQKASMMTTTDAVPQWRSKYVEDLAKRQGVQPQSGAVTAPPPTSTAKGAAGGRPLPPPAQGMVRMTRVADGTAVDIPASRAADAKASGRFQ